MTKETDYLIQSLFDRENLEEMTLDELKGYAEQYPYSSIIQFLYTCKLKSLYHIDFPDTVTKTAIFFNDPYWLNFQLSEEAERGGIKRTGYDYNLQERKETASAELDPEPVESAKWTDEDGYEHDEELTEASYTGGFLAEKLNFPQMTVQQELPTDLDQLIPIEPYHTVDYFASQGIKLSQTLEKDELGKKVKSFTDWLRTMKKLQPESAETKSKEQLPVTPTVKDENIPSNVVITEALAEVYLKQGLTDKAIEVYNKLSLQNPANKHIFAAKISLIKENNI
jgi:hypothetical protein